MKAGVYKICSCKGQLKCRHPWWFSMTRRGERRIRASLDVLFGKHIESKTEAEKHAERLRNDIVEGKVSPRIRELLKLPADARPVLELLTVGNLLAQYEERHLSRLASHDRLAYKVGAIKRALVARADGSVLPFGDWPVLDVTADALDRLREARTVKTMRQAGRVRHVSGGQATADKDLRLLRAAFKWALRKRIVESSPFRWGEETTVTFERQRARSRRLQEGEGERLAGACGTQLRPLVEAALESGCRLGELLSLQVHQVQFTPRAEIWLPAGKTKTGKARRVPMSSRLRAVLEMRIAQLRTVIELDADEPTPGALYVFGNEIGERVGSIKTAWRLACRRAGIEDLHFHDLRREAGSRWMEGGVPLATIQRWLGHANISQTSTYLATTVQSEHDAMQRFDEARLTQIDRRGATGRRRRPSKAKTQNTETRESTVKH